MKPIGPLMREHRLIERMVSLLKLEFNVINETGKTKPEFITIAVDFFRTYADKTHHGKEENILFRDLLKKQLPSELNKILDELITEHIHGRKTVGNLVTAKERYVRGDKTALEDIANTIRELIVFYPEHIEKEDKHFFYPCQELFSKKEQDVMLEEFWEFDRKLIHDKYRQMIEDMEN
jgi:hemerythrin-like domain-containing protein